ncbi:expressed unknown protein [Seminavis robusta]|uniref:Uncharacterized protein n=1 Tax=Seminavis robusta TaxID=568900 RepID=A0A9N8HNN6_9STRA|nr:expressed unknown protein [Seminavis robusta]|eukprot:Sro836_g208970.1 n/a (326) ;mRNA; f:18327-19466
MRISLPCLVLVGLASSGKSQMIDITFRVGLLHAPPFTFIAEEEDREGTNADFSGFTPDLLNSLVEFAKADNFNLNLVMSPSPPEYNPAFDLVASDCEEVSMDPPIPLPPEECENFDIMAPNYYATAARSLRAGLTPPIQRSSISTIKLKSSNINSLAQAEAEGGVVCLVEGTFYAGLVQDTYPAAEYVFCPTAGDCKQNLQDGVCVLDADDELMLRYAAAQDSSLEVTDDSFSTQYIVYAYKDSLPADDARWFEKWMWDANTNTTNDQLFQKYFSGTSAEDGIDAGCPTCSCDDPLYEFASGDEEPNKNSRKGVPGSRRTRGLKG